MCGEEHGSFKSYMDYRCITSKTSAQYKLIYSDEIVVGSDGLLYCGEYVGVALGSKYGNIGDKFIITLDTGKEFKAIKVDAKADAHTYYGCHHRTDASVVEFVIDTDRARDNYSLALKMGSFDYVDAFKGVVVKIEKVVS